MEHGNPEMGSNPGGEQRRGFLKRVVRTLIDKIIPPLEPYDPTMYSIEVPAAEEVENVVQDASPLLVDGDDQPDHATAPAEEPEPSIIVTLDKGGAFYVSSEASAPIGPLTTHYNSIKLLHDLGALYFAFGRGEYSLDSIAAKVNYKPSTVTQISERLSGLFPPEVISVYEAEEGDTRIAFGNLALTSLLEGQPTPLEINNPYRQTPEQIDADKLDLTTQAHAIIDITGLSQERFYLPLHSYASMMAVRVVEAIKYLRAAGASKGVQCSDIAERVWQSMTVAERQAFVADDKIALFSNASKEIEIPVLRVLRRLTNKLMLTHERHTDRFTLLGTEISIAYSDQPLTERRAAKLGNMRPIIPPEQTADEPAKERQAEYLDLARAYMRQAKSRRSVVDEEAIAMLDFLMSPHGHWAVRSVAGEKGLFKTYDGAMYALHTYLRVHFHGYGPAYRSRLISGNRVVRRGKQTGGIRQVGGVIPKDSNWVLGHGLEEFFGEKPTADS